MKPSTRAHQRLAAVAEQAAMAPPTLADVAPLLDRLPILADRLAQAPQSELRAPFDKLQLDITYQPGDSVLDVASPSTTATRPTAPRRFVRRSSPCPRGVFDQTCDASCTSRPACRSGDLARSCH